VGLVVGAESRAGSREGGCLNFCHTRTHTSAKGGGLPKILLSHTHNFGEGLSEFCHTHTHLEGVKWLPKFFVNNTTHSNLMLTVCRCVEP
jgi:hypothetical protein